MYSLVLFFPFLAFIQALAFGFFFGRQLSSFFSVLLLLGSVLISWFVFFEVCVLQVTATLPLFS